MLLPIVVLLLSILGLLGLLSSKPSLLQSLGKVSSAVVLLAALGWSIATLAEIMHNHRPAPVSDIDQVTPPKEENYAKAATMAWFGTERVAGEFRFHHFVPDAVNPEDGKAKQLEPPFRSMPKVLAVVGANTVYFTAQDRKGKLDIWKCVNDKIETWGLQGTEVTVLSMTGASDGTALALAKVDGVVKVFHRRGEEWREIVNIADHSGDHGCAAVCFRGAAFSGTGTDGKQRLWQLDGGTIQSVVAPGPIHRLLAERGTVVAEIGGVSHEYDVDAHTFAAAPATDGDLRRQDPGVPDEAAGPRRVTSLLVHEEFSYQGSQCAIATATATDELGLYLKSGPDWVRKRTIGTGLGTPRMIRPTTTFVNMITGNKTFWNVTMDGPDDSRDFDDGEVPPEPTFLGTVAGEMLFVGKQSGKGLRVYHWWADFH